jgi:hypothetical protein
MGATEKKIAVVLVVVLIAMVAVYATTGGKPEQNPMMGERPQPAATPAASNAAPVVILNPGSPGQSASPGGAACPTGSPSGGTGVKTQVFGKPGAKLEILALLPITHGCHVNTEAELKKAFEQHAGDIHLTIVDLFGPEAASYLPKVGNRVRAVVSINGKTKFELKGRPVVLEQAENGSYSPGDIGPIVEAELRK